MDAAVQAVQVPGLAVADVLVQLLGLILGCDTHRINTGIDAVGQREVHNAVFAAEGHRRFCRFLCQRVQTRATSAGKDHCHDFFCHNFILPFCFAPLSVRGENQHTVTTPSGPWACRLRRRLILQRLFPPWSCAGCLFLGFGLFLRLGFLGGGALFHLGLGGAPGGGLFLAGGLGLFGGGLLGGGLAGRGLGGPGLGLLLLGTSK